MTADGVWTYTLDNNNCAVQALNAGGTLTDTFTVTTVDGTAQVVTITINGTNDADQNYFDHLATEKVIFDGRSLLGLGEYDFTSRTRFPVLNFHTLSSSQMWATPQRRSVVTKTLLAPTHTAAIADEVPTTELSLLAQDLAHMGSAVGTHLHDLMV